MAITCINGHVNDDANRFCDQCGVPLEAASDPAAPVADASEAVPVSTSGSNACPVCGQENVPGTAFCDNCGAALPPPQPVATGEEPVSGSPASGDQASAPVADGAIVCAQCGTANDASNQFCDNCGASLNDQQAPSGAAAEAELPVPAAQATEAEVPLQEAEVNGVPPAPDMTVATPLPMEGDTMPAPPEEEQAAPAAPAPAAESSADRQRLEDEIATQQKLIAQFEQMQQTFGAATPAVVLQGLDEARQKLAQAESDLAAISAQPQVDPAEVARLQDEIATQQKLIMQFEQMQQTFGPATPVAVTQGLDEARQKVSQAESRLGSLTGGQPDSGMTQQAPNAPAAPDHSHDAAAAPAPPPPMLDAPLAPAQSQPAQSQPVPAPPRGTDQLPPAVAQPQATGPRLITRDGVTITLPRGGGDVVVGREDPISGIHPEVDLTPHGGEAGGVSRRHAVLREQNGQWMLTDLDSTNYTRIDGNRLPPHTPTPVPDGARVQFGRLDMEFHTS